PNPLLRREVPRRDRQGGPTVPLVVALEGVPRGEDAVHRLEREQPLARRQELAEARLLRDHRAPGGQVAGAAVAEPAGTRADVLVAGNGELAARAPDVVTVLVDVARDRH